MLLLIIAYHLSHLVILLYHFLVTCYLLIVDKTYFLDIEFVEPTSAAASPTDGETLSIMHYINTWFILYPELL